MVGKRERLHAESFSFQNQLFYFREAVKKGVMAMGMEMDEFHAKIVA